MSFHTTDIEILTSGEGFFFFFCTGRASSSVFFLACISVSDSTIAPEMIRTLTGAPSITFFFFGGMISSSSSSVPADRTAANASLAFLALAFAFARSSFKVSTSS